MEPQLTQEHQNIKSQLKKVDDATQMGIDAVQSLRGRCKEEVVQAKIRQAGQNIIREHKMLIALIEEADYFKSVDQGALNELVLEGERLVFMWVEFIIKRALSLSDSTNVMLS